MRRDFPRQAHGVTVTGVTRYGVTCYRDGVDGAPNGISVPRWSLSPTHLKGSRPWASLSGISPLSPVSGSIWRRRSFRSTPSTRRAKWLWRARSRAAGSSLRRVGAVRGGDGGLLLGPSLGAAISGARARGEADPAGACEALCPAQQERRGRRGGDLRGGGSAGSEVRVGALDRQPGRVDAPSGARAPRRPAHLVA